MTTEAGPPAGTLEETRRVAQNHLLQLRGVRRGKVLDEGSAAIPRDAVARNAGGERRPPDTDARTGQSYRWGPSAPLPC